MSAEPMEELAASITARVLAVDGVRGLFSPRDPVLLARALDRPSTRSVRLDASSPTLRITARLATDRTVAAREVVASVTAAVDELLDSSDYDLELEIAVIE